MANVPTRIQNRLISGIKRFQPVLASAKARDVNESDTSTIVTDMLSEVFGYDKYSEVTSEHAIRGTFCDLATVVDGKTQLLVEVKATGLELKDSFVKQAVDYAANKGTEWVVLTNAVLWRIYKIVFGKPLDFELVAEIDFMTLDPKSTDHLEQLFVLTKEGWVKNVLSDLHSQRQALNKFLIAAVTASEPVVDVIRRELRRVCPDVKILPAQVEQVLISEVIKRELAEGEKADEAKRKLSRCANRLLRARLEKTQPEPEVGGPETVAPAASGIPETPPVGK